MFTMEQEIYVYQGDKEDVFRGAEYGVYQGAEERCLLRSRGRNLLSSRGGCLPLRARDYDLYGIQKQSI
jgi:hypothetical protein